MAMLGDTFFKFVGVPGVVRTVAPAAKLQGAVILCARHGRGIGGESPLGTPMEGTRHRRGKGAFDKGVNTEVFLVGEGAVRWRLVEA